MKNSSKKSITLGAIALQACLFPLALQAQSQVVSSEKTGSFLQKLIGSVPLNGTTERFLELYGQQNPPNLRTIPAELQCKVWIEKVSGVTVLNYYSGKNSPVQKFKFEKNLKNHLLINNKVVSGAGGLVQGPILGVDASDSPYNSYGREDDGYGVPNRPVESDPSSASGPYLGNPPTRGSYAPGSPQPADPSRPSGPYQQNPAQSRGYPTGPQGEHAESVEKYQVVSKSGSGGLTIRITEAFGKMINVTGSAYKPARALQISISTSNISNKNAQLKNCSLFYK